MIISRTPLRMSFVGGGSDVPEFYRQYGGAVVSTSIRKYVYITVNQKFDDHIRISYSKTEEVASVDQIEHNLVREVMRALDITGGVEITSIADIPSRGTGLGSSSSFTVGLLHALYAFKGQYVSAAALADQSCMVEIERCGEPIGKQDQYAAAYGGLNLITFNPDDSIFVDPIICRPETVEQMQAGLVAFYTGMTRNASDLLKRQTAVVEQDKGKQKTVQDMVELAYILRDELQKNNAEVLGDILHENWILKKSLMDGISSPVIDHWYETALRAGATGGKLLGAGGGGFLIFYVPLDKRDHVMRALPELRPVEFQFGRSGSRIVFYS